MNLRIITKEKETLSTETSSVSLPGECGRMQVLPGHANLIAKLQKGLISYSTGSNIKTIPIHGGIVEVAQDNITVLIN